MGLRFSLAQMTSVISTWALKNVFRRPAANFPGKIGLYLDPQIISHLRPRIHEGAIVVVGTNGKTTVTNLIADALDVAGKSVACNRTGANLDSGVATALLHAGQVDWAVLESDELWLAKVLPQLQPDYVVLLNLFRDQLDRSGEIDHVQESIKRALASSPNTTLIYNADDPLCQAIASAADNEHVAFGIGEDLHLPQDTVIGAGVCQTCGSMLAYEWHQYGQLGMYRCPNCGFAREEPHYCAHDVKLESGGASFVLHHDTDEAQVTTSLPGAYMVYNLLAVHAAANCCKVDFACVDDAVRAFSPDNGRLQSYTVAGRSVLLNLAKNPVGLNQNLRIALNEDGPCSVAFFINDKEADGHDVSWLWDVDFQQLCEASEIRAFAGGIRGRDVQVRLKYAGVDAHLAEGATDVLAETWAQEPDAKIFIIANYTALPGVKAELDRLQRASDQGRLTEEVFPESPSQVRTRNEIALQRERAAIEPSENPARTEKLVIAHLYPELLNLYGDGGNVTVLAERARRRGFDVQVLRVKQEQDIDFSQVDIVFLGGGPDREQRVASECLLAQAKELRAYVEDDGVLLAICGGFQIMGHEWLLGNDAVPGLRLADFTTKRAPGGSHNRLVGNIVLSSPVARTPVVGYENHAGRTFLGPTCKPFGQVINKQAKGNNDTDGVDGILYRNVIGTYLHGPLLSKNPEVADWLLERALTRRAAKENRPITPLAPLDDTAEQAANQTLRTRLHIH